MIKQEKTMKEYDESTYSLVSKLASLKDKHQRLHEVIESLEAEKAPEEYIKLRKREKLSIKDEIERTERALRNV